MKKKEESGLRKKDIARLFTAFGGLRDELYEFDNSPSETVGKLSDVELLATGGAQLLAKAMIALDKDYAKLDKAYNGLQRQVMEMLAGVKESAQTEGKKKKRLRRKK